MVLNKYKSICQHICNCNAYICMYMYIIIIAPNLIGSDTMYCQIWSHPLTGSVILIIDTFANKTECSLEKTIFGIFWNNKWLHLALCLSNESIGVLQMNAETFTILDNVRVKYFYLKKIIHSRLFDWSQIAQRTSPLKALRRVIFVSSTFFSAFWSFVQSVSQNVTSDVP